MRRFTLWRLSLVAVMATGLCLSSTTPSFALSGSTFEATATDGNLLINTPGNTDWCNQPMTFSGTCRTSSLAPNLKVALDKASGSGDDSFGNGSKEDMPTPTVTSGSIPSNKSDLTRFYVANEYTGGNNYVYLAWERANALGSANMDFEFNQSQTLSSNGVTPVRSPGDMLITFDFGGSGTPSLGLLKWVTSANGTTSDCYSSSSLPCWGKHVDLTASGYAEGAVNYSASVTDPISTTAPRTLPANTFGEAAINLTQPGIFPANRCESLGSAYLKSRSSASFTAELKDFIAPQPVHVSNCGTITIHNVTENGDASFGYTATPTTGGLNPLSFNLTNGGMEPYINVPAGLYSVTESTVPSGWALKSLNCTPTGTGTTASPSGATASITIVGGGTVDCTYTNTPQLGAIKITKTSSANSSMVLSGAQFSVTNNSNSTVITSTPTGQDGTACVDGLAWSGTGTTYTVKETTPPNGFQINPNAQSVTVSKNSTCGDGNEATISFTDTPQLGAITISKTSSNSSAAPLQGATFDISTDPADINTVATVTTDSNGMACKDNLAPGAYYVTETKAPTGYNIDNPYPVSVTVDHGASCSSGTPNAAPTFTDTPLTGLVVTATGEVPNATNSTITCVDSSNNSVGSSGTNPTDPANVTAKGLKPGTYTCTVVVAKT